MIVNVIQSNVGKKQKRKAGGGATVIKMKLIGLHFCPTSLLKYDFNQ